LLLNNGEVREVPGVAMMLWEFLFRNISITVKKYLKGGQVIECIRKTSTG
jgi:hypothetical protein